MSMGIHVFLEMKFQSTRMVKYPDITVVFCNCVTAVRWGKIDVITNMRQGRHPQTIISKSVHFDESSSNYTSCHTLF